MVKVLGRARIFDTGDPCEVDVWVHELEPMKPGQGGGEAWAREHFSECYTEDQLREMFGLPNVGNFQVLFTGDLDAKKSFNGEITEYDEWFEIDSDTLKYEPIPEEWMKFLGEGPALEIREENP